MTQWNLADWLTFFAAAGTFAGVIATQLERVIRALKENTAVTKDASTANLESRQQETEKVTTALVAQTDAAQK